MKPIHVLLATTVAGLAVPAWGQAAGAPAACRLRIENGGSSWIIRGYDPFGNSPASGTFQITFVNEGDADCVFYPTFATDGEPFGLRGRDGRRVPYALVDLSGGVDSTPVAGRSRREPNRSRLVVAPNSQQAVQYRFVVAEETIAGDGLYEQQIQIEAEDPEGRSINGRRIALGIDVLPSATLGLTGAYRVDNGRALVNLGELREGQVELPLQLRVQSTRPYRLTVQSMNSGRLQMQGTDWAIPYTISLGGQSVLLGGGSTELSGPNGQGLTRDSLPVHFQIGSVSDRRAGTYGDVISVSVQPQ